MSRRLRIAALSLWPGLPQVWSGHRTLCWVLASSIAAVASVSTSLGSGGVLNGRGGTFLALGVLCWVMGRHAAGSVETNEWMMTRLELRWLRLTLGRLVMGHEPNARTLERLGLVPIRVAVGEPAVRSLQRRREAGRTGW